MSSILEGPEIVRAVRRQSRRLVYFFGELDNHLGRRFICTFLQSPNLLAFLDYGKGKTGLDGRSGDDTAIMSFRCFRSTSSGFAYLIKTGK